MDPEQQERERITKSFEIALEMLRNADEDSRWQVFKEKNGQEKMKIEAHKHIYTKSQMTIPYSSEKVVEFLSNPFNRTLVDPTYKQVEKLREYPNGLKLIYSKFNVGDEHRESIVVVGTHTDSDYVTMLASRSIDYDEKPEVVPRVQIDLEGFVIRPIDQENCKISWIVKIDSHNMNTQEANRIMKDQHKFLPKIGEYLSRQV